MDNLEKSTILYVNQVRQDNFDILIGKGFSEAFSWRNYFKRIVFVCYSTTNEYLFKKKYSNCYLIGIPFKLSTNSMKSLINLGKNYFKLYYILHGLKKVTKIDIIRMENLLLSGPPIYLFSRVKKIPYVIWLGGNEREALYIKYNKNLFTWFLSKLIIVFEILILKNSNFVFPVTDDLYNLTIKRNVNNKILSPNFVDLSKFVDLKKDIDSRKKITVLYVGRFEEEKGIKILLNAIKSLSEIDKKVEFLMVGDGSLNKWIQDFILNKNVKNVKLLGKFDHEEMPKIYSLADIFILPSYTEGSPAALLEAMSCGLACIATEVGECKKIIINNQNGLLIPPADADLLSSAIKSLVNDKELLKKFSKNARIFVLDYIKNYKKIHKYVYEQLLKNN